MRKIILAVVMIVLYTGSATPASAEYADVDHQRLQNILSALEVEARLLNRAIKEHPSVANVYLVLGGAETVYSATDYVIALRRLREFIERTAANLQ